MSRVKSGIIRGFSFLPYGMARFVARVALATQGIGFAGLIEESGEAALLRRLRRLELFGATPTFVDVGGHVGEYTCLLKRLWPRATVFAFEPSDAHFRRLQTAVSGLQDVHVFQAGLSSRNATLTLHKPEEVSGMASLEQRDLSHLGIAEQIIEQVQVMTLESVVAQNGMAHVDLMKVDIEGHELSCFEGAATLIRERRIGMGQFEYGHAHIASKTSVFDFFRTFTPFGYKMGVVKPDGSILFFPAYDEFLETNIATNYIAVLPELAVQLGLRDLTG
jgi:FkbM family methyltransferase